MKLSCITPKKEDLWYRKSIVEDELTMEFNNGTVPFPEEKWDDWYARWIGNGNPNFWYAYLVDNDSKEYVGEIAYRKRNDEEDFATLNIIVEHKHRGKGYAVMAVNLLKKVFKIKKDGIRAVTLTWNGENKIAGGVGSEKGLTAFGKKIIEQFNKNKSEANMFFSNIKVMKKRRPHPLG